MSDRVDELNVMAEEALKDEKKLEELCDKLATGTRRERQQTAQALSIVAAHNPELLVPYINNFVDALNRPEAQTRWECLETLAVLVDLDPRNCNKAIPEAEASLFDEESGPVRLAAMRFLCKLGATTPARSEKVWPLIDEGIQCYHGDLEFNDMLTAINEFSTGKLAPEVKQSLIDRMSFDAANGKGSLGRRAQQIIDNLS